MWQRVYLLVVYLASDVSRHLFRQGVALSKEVSLSKEKLGMQSTADRCSPRTQKRSSVRQHLQSLRTRRLLWWTKQAMHHHYSRSKGAVKMSPA